MPAGPRALSGRARDHPASRGQKRCRIEVRAWRHARPADVHGDCTGAARTHEVTRRTTPSPLDYAPPFFLGLSAAGAVMSADTPTAGTGPDESPDTPLFSALGLPEPLLRVAAELGYERPSPIQAATIPPLLEGRDVLGQAQTGTGKTAAFALPVLARLDVAQKAPQALVLAPTRELAIQVAEAFQSYAAHLPGFTVLPIYGGQSYYPQLQALKRGVQVVVGTPGRIIDHLDRGSLDLSQLR